jgi:hypothetical protein
MNLKIAVIDGMGGSIGHQIILKLRENFPEAEILALATNAVATHNMMKAGANQGASGENAFKLNLQKVKYIVAPLATTIPHSMLGELTPKMAEAVALSPAKKIYLPLTNPKVEIAGITHQPIPHLMEEVVKKIKKFEAGGESNV